MCVADSFKPMNHRCGIQTGSSFNKVSSEICLFIQGFMLVITQSQSDACNFEILFWWLISYISLKKISYFLVNTLANLGEIMLIFLISKQTISNLEILIWTDEAKMKHSFNQKVFHIIKCLTIILFFTAESWIKPSSQHNCLTGGYWLTRSGEWANLWGWPKGKIKMLSEPTERQVRVSYTTRVCG